MLKITQTQSAPGEIRLILEGRLVGPWVAELQATTARLSAKTVQLDLAGLRFMDGAGLALVLALEAQGAELRNASPFVQELLEAVWKFPPDRSK
jgi:ABC-type transporter Mla MlaB component